MEHFGQPSPERPHYPPLDPHETVEPNDIRMDADGNLWRYEQVGHTVARELEIQSAGPKYWDERLETHSDDVTAALTAFEASSGTDVDNAKAAESAFGQPAYGWRLYIPDTK